MDKGNIRAIDGGKEKKEKVRVSIKTTDGENEVYFGEYFGKSLEFEDFLVVGSADLAEPVYLIRLDTIVSIEARDYGD